MADEALARAIRQSCAARLELLNVVTRFYREIFVGNAETLTNKTSCFMRPWRNETWAANEYRLIVAAKNRE